VGFYPYGGAVIGQWGFDIATSTLYNPGSNFDYMSYCAPEWTSDYTYRAVYDAWSWVTDPFGAAAVSAADESWVISGYRNTAGEWHVAPARMQAVPVNAAPAAGQQPGLREQDGRGVRRVLRQPRGSQPNHDA
jgi:hypothetical protein